jgi:PAS domain S-box-containing protein
VEEEFYLESGQTVFMDTVKCPIVDDQGRVTGIAGASRDITARKKKIRQTDSGYDLGWMTNSISEEFINIKIENLKFGLHKVLQKVGSFLGVDRAFIVVLPGIASEVEPVHYWCADGITRQPEYMNTLMQREDSEALKKLGEGKALSLPSVDTALDLTDAERSLMQGDGMRSLIIFPMISGDDVMGYMGFDALYEERELSDSLQAMVQLIVNIVSRTFERIKAEEALKESEKNFREMIDHATDAIMVDDFEGNIMVVNKQQALRTGYSKEEILSMNIMDLFPYSFGFKDTNERRERLVSGEPVIFEHIVQGKDGSKLDVEVKLAKTTWNGKPAIFSISRDITQRKKIEQELRESEARFRILIEQSRDGSVILDQEGNVYQSNKQFAAMIGYPLEEVSRLNVSDWEYLYSREQVMEMIRTVDESGDHFETLHCRKDGTTYSVEISTNGAVIGGQKLIFCICRDITERKRDEEALRERRPAFVNCGAGG